MAVVGELDRLVEIDDAACLLYARVGIRLEFPRSHPFIRAELRRWQLALESGAVWVVVDETNRAQGFAVLGKVNGAGYLDQLSVHPSFMRRGLGGRLIEQAVSVAADTSREIWLTTYSHLPWNRAYYERWGFRSAEQSKAPPALQQLLAEQRRYLPMPWQRVAMVRKLDGHG